MKHAEKRMAGRYVDAFSWHRTIRSFLEEIVTEHPILNVCSGPSSVQCSPIRRETWPKGTK